MSLQLLSRTYATDKQPKKVVLSTTSNAARRAGTHPLAHLQQALGNHAVAGLIQARRLAAETGFVIQPKLAVGPAHDHYEQEADAVANRVMTMPVPPPPRSVQRQPAREEKDKDKTLQTKPLAASITPLVQCQMMPEEEEKKPVQAKPLAASITPFVQCQTAPEEDNEKPVQTKPLTASITPLVQRDMIPEEDKEKKPVQARLTDSAAGLLQREMGTDEEKETKEKPIQAKLTTQRAAAMESFEAGEDLESRLSHSKGGGSPLPDYVQAYMEPRFGVDFSGVRVHTDHESAHMNQEVGAQAFTHGQDIYFGTGKGPDVSDLTAHELTHVVQQTGNVPLQMKRLDGASSIDGEPFLQRVCSACVAADKEKKPSDPIISRSINGTSASSDVEPIQRRITGGGVLQRKIFAQTQGDFRATFSPRGAVTGTGLPEPVDLSYSKDADEDTIHSESVEIPEQTAGDIALTVFSSWGSSHVLPPPNKKSKCEPCELLKEKIGAKIFIVPTAGFFEIVSDQFKQACQTKRNFIDKARFTRKVLETLEKDPCALKDTAETALCSATKAGIEVANKATPIGNPLTKLEDQVKEIAAKLGEMELLCEEDPLEVMTGSGQTQFNVSFVFDDEGNLQVSGPQPVTQSRGAGAQVETNGLKETNTGGAVASLTVMIRYTNVQAVGNQEIPNATSFTQQFNVNLTRLKPQPVACCRRVFPFVVGTDKFQNEDAAHKQLFTWWEGLHPTVKKSVERGKTPIVIAGHASATGSQKFNLELSQKRANRVKNILQSFFGSDSHPNVFAFGRLLAKQPGEVAEERRADVKIAGEVRMEEGVGLFSCGPTNEPTVCDEFPV